MPLQPVTSRSASLRITVGLAWVAASKWHLIKRAWGYWVVEDKLRHIRNLRISLSKNPLEWGRTKPQIVRSTPQTEARERLIQRKCRNEGNHLVGYSLKPSWLFVIGCPQSFKFAILKHVQAEILVCLCRPPWH